MKKLFSALFEFTQGGLSMKKLISVIIATIIFALCMVPCVSAEETVTTHSAYGTYLTVIDKGTYCFMENEYYSLFVDEYLEPQFDFYKEAYDYWTGEKVDYFVYQQKEFIQSSDGVNKTFAYETTPDKMDGHIYYQTVIFNYEGEPDADRNMTLAESLSEGMDVLYVGTTTPCAVVKMRGGTSDFLNILENKNVEFFMTAFVCSDWNNVNLAIFEEAFAPTAADARKILRYSAGLDNAPENISEAKKFLLLSDTDYDGKLTAADARKAIRIAAGLEKGHEFWFNSSGCGDWWQY